MNTLTPFHLAVPVYDLEESRKFYREVLGCREGRNSEHWTDFNLYGHQFVIHLQPRPPKKVKNHNNQVDGYQVPVPHYGVVLEWELWHALEKRLKQHNVKFVV